jgi:signal transduction histidine kinase
MENQEQGGSRRPASRRFGDRWTLLPGFAAVIALQVFSLVEAYTIQSKASERHLEIYRRYARQEEASTTVRRTMWLAGGHVRDFFLRQTPETAEELRGQLRDLKAESLEALNELERGEDSRTIRSGLRSSVEEFWGTIEPVPDTMLHAGNDEAYAFVQREMIPRRSTLYGALRELSTAGQHALQYSEDQFAGLRRGSGRRLLLILGASVLLAMLVAGLSLGYAGRLEREAWRQYQQAEQAHRELAALSAGQVEAEEQWRKRLSRELHDEIGQALALLQIELTGGVKDPDGARQRLARGREMVERLVQTVRDISLLLRPSLLDDLGLVAALEWLTEDFTRRSAIPCAFRAQDVPEALPETVATCVYRIVQESLHNAEKHSGASRAGVRIAAAAGRLVVEVEDNGRGFDRDPSGRPRSNAGLGLLGMRERATRLGGGLALESAAGGGTRVRLTVPLAAGETTQKETARA